MRKTLLLMLMNGWLSVCLAAPLNQTMSVKHPALVNAIAQRYLNWVVEQWPEIKKPLSEAKSLGFLSNLQSFSLLNVVPIQHRFAVKFAFSRGELKEISLFVGLASDKERARARSFLRRRGVKVKEPLHAIEWMAYQKIVRAHYQNWQSKEFQSVNWPAKLTFQSRVSSVLHRGDQLLLNVDALPLSLLSGPGGRLAFRHSQEFSFYVSTLEYQSNKEFTLYYP